jgi:hypothetical protein
MVVFRIVRASFPENETASRNRIRKAAYPAPKAGRSRDPRAPPTLPENDPV